MENKEMAKDSKDIQLLSLSLFAQSLEYDTYNISDRGSFATDLPAMREYPRISLHSMVLLHNFLQNCVSLDGEYVVAHVGQKVFKIPVYLANRAIASKLVEAVDISVDKKVGKFKTGKQWVKFVNGSRPIAEHLLGGDLS